MRSRSLWLIGAAVLLSSLVACGGGQSNAFGFGPISVTSMTPASVPALIPTPVVIGGADFSEIISDGTDPIPTPDCDVMFIAVSPAGVTPFHHGTSDRTVVKGRITSATTIALTSPLATICGPTVITARVRVTLPSGVRGESATAIATFRAPTVTMITATGGGNIFPAAIPTGYVLTGADFPAGGTVNVYWETPVGDPPLFGGPIAGPPTWPVNPQTGTGPQIITTATITSSTTIVGISPPAVVCEPGAAVPHIAPAVIDLVTFEDGSCTPTGTAVPTGFRAPRIDDITNDSGAVTHTGLSEFAAAVPESFFIDGADFGPVGGLAQVVLVSQTPATMFEGGTTTSTVVVGQIISQVRIEGISPPALVCQPGGTLFADVSVILPGGSCTPNTTPAEFFAPVFNTIVNLDAPGLTPDFEAAMGQRFRITGDDFGPDGGTAGVRFTAQSGNLIFEIGTVDTTEVAATIVDRNTIEGVMPQALLCDAAVFGGGAEAASELVDLLVTLEGGSCFEEIGPSTILGPTLTDMQVTLGALLFGPGSDFTVTLGPIPSTQPLAATAGLEALLNGSGYGPLGASAVVTLTANSGNLIFTGGTSATLDIPAVVLDQNTIELDLPYIDAPRLTDDEIIDVTVTLVPNGSCTHFGDLFLYAAPPTITTVTHADQGTGNGFLVPIPIQANRFFGCISSTMDIDGTAFDDGVGLEALTTIYHAASGVDPITKVPLRRLGQDPTLVPDVPLWPNDLGLPAPGLPTYTVAPLLITGETRIDTGLAALDANGDFLETFTVRVVNPVDSQFHEATAFFDVRTGELNLTALAANHNNNVSVAIDPTSVPDDFGTPTLPTDPLNNANMTVVANNDVIDIGFFSSPDIFLAYTRDGGITWTPAPVDITVDIPFIGTLSGFEVRTHAKVAYDMYGNLFLSYVIDDPLDLTGGFFGTAWQVLAESSDQGASWFVNYSFPFSLGSIDHPDLSVGPSQITPGTVDIAVSYVEIASPAAGFIDDVQLRVAQTAGFAGPLAAPVFFWGSPFFPLSDAFTFFPFGSRVDAQCAVGPSGEYYVSWTEFDVFTGDSFIVYDVNRDGGGLPILFGADVILVSQPALPAPPAPAPDSFFLPQKDMTVVPLGTNQGRMVLAYEQLTPGFAFPPAGIQNLQVATLYTDDFRVNFSTPQIVHQTVAGDQILPAIAADRATGALYVTWYDTKNDQPAYATVERFSARSDNGATWGNAQDLSATTSLALPGVGFTDYGQYCGVDAYNGCVLAGWAVNTDPVGEFMDAFVRLYQQTANATP